MLVLVESEFYISEKPVQFPVHFSETNRDSVLTRLGVKIQEQ